MTEEPKPTEGQDPTTPEPGTPEPTPERFKDDPTYKAMSQQIAEMRQKEQEREAAEEKARKDAEIKALEEKGEYESALSKERETRKAAQKKATFAELKAELLAKGAQDSEGLFKVALAEYDGKSDMKEFAESMKNSDNYKNFFGSDQPTRDPKAPPSPAGGGSNPSFEQVKAWEKSDKREERLKALEFNRAYRVKYGKYPD